MRTARFKETTLDFFLTRTRILRRPPILQYSTSTNIVRPGEGKISRERVERKGKKRRGCLSSVLSVLEASDEPALHERRIQLLQRGFLQPYAHLDQSKHACTARHINPTPIIHGPPPTNNFEQRKTSSSYCNPFYIYRSFVRTKFIYTHLPSQRHTRKPVSPVTPDTALHGRPPGSCRFCCP